MKKKEVEALVWFLFLQHIFLHHNIVIIMIYIPSLFPVQADDALFPIFAQLFFTKLCNDNNNVYCFVLGVFQLLDIIFEID